VANSVGEAAAQWHEFLDWMRDPGEMDIARREFQAAFNYSPKSTQIQIELAGQLALGNQADLEEGLKLMQPVVDQFPDDPNFLFTHGKILAGLKRYAEAKWTWPMPLPD